MNTYIMSIRTYVRTYLPTYLPTYIYATFIHGLFSWTRDNTRYPLYVHVHVHTHIYAYIYKTTHICLHAHTYVCLYTHTLATHVGKRHLQTSFTLVCITHSHTSIHIQIHIHIYTHSHTHMYIHIHIQIYTLTHTYMYIHIQIYTHTHTYIYIYIHALAYLGGEKIIKSVCHKYAHSIVLCSFLDCPLYVCFQSICIQICVHEYYFVSAFPAFGMYALYIYMCVCMYVCM
jgi:hypothetical protein